MKQKPFFGDEVLVALKHIYHAQTADLDRCNQINWTTSSFIMCFYHFNVFLPMFGHLSCQPIRN